MSWLLENENFRRDFDRLSTVKLNPDRHTAPDGRAHTEAVARRVEELCRINACTTDELELLRTLAYVHDIGKIETRRGHPAASERMLPSYGIDDPHLASLVKYHDVALAWYRQSERGQPPSDRAWHKLSRRLDVRLLGIFMIADRVDCRGGWRENPPTIWFFEELRRRGLLEREPLG
jgi:hypothetical protein